MRRLPVLLALALAGCGSGSAGSRPGAAAGTGSAGARVFADSCRMCHTLGPGDRRNVQGGTLDGYRMTLSQIEDFTRVMPVSLTPAQVREVSLYVLPHQGER